MKDEQYFNPFGPNFLTATIEEDVRLKLLECVKDHSTNAWEDPSVISSYSAQKNSIVDGKLGDIAPTVLELMNIEKPVEMTGNSLLN